MAHGHEPSPVRSSGRDYSPALVVECFAILCLPLPATEVPPGSFDCNSSCIIRSWQKFLQRPTRHFSRIFSILEECCRFSWYEGNIELIERDGQAFSPCFDIRFFACPTVKKGLLLYIVGQRTEKRLLIWRKAHFGQSLVINACTFILKINPDLPGKGKSVQCKIVRMGDVEL